MRVCSGEVLREITTLQIALTTLTRSSDGHGEISGEMRQTEDRSRRRMQSWAVSKSECAAYYQVAAVFTIDKIGARVYIYRASVSQTVCVCECVYVSV